MYRRAVGVCLDQKPLPNNGQNGTNTDFLFDPKSSSLLPLVIVLVCLSVHNAVSHSC